MKSTQRILFFFFALFVGSHAFGQTDSVMSYSTTNIKNATQFNPVTGGKHHRANELLNNRIIKIENKHNDSITALRGSINVLSATKVNYSTLSDTALQLRSDLALKTSLRDTSILLRNILATKTSLIDTAANKWGMQGNSLSVTGKIGSTTNQGISFITNNVERASISNVGEVEIDGLYIGQRGQRINNNFFGYQTGLLNTTGSNNNFFGYRAGISNTTGAYNNFFGHQTGYSNVTGAYNNFFGGWAGYSNTTANGNNFFGYYAGQGNTIGEYNNFFGYYAGYSNVTGYDNNFFGTQAGLLNTTGSNNNFFGYRAGYLNTIGANNNFFGHQTGYSNVTGYGNNFFGTQAGFSNAMGNNNTVIGNVDLGDVNDNFCIATGSTKRIWGVVNNIAIGNTLVAPHSTAHVQGSFASKFNAINSNTTLDNTHSIIEITNSGVTITLPNANTCAGREYKLIKTVSGGSVTIATNGGLINGNATHNMTTQYTSHVLISNGVDWLIIASN